ncbi:MAG TPA: YqgE/AlgH family protein [Nitrospirota bacterium]|nr:YqgE/AlgH family protein [Nitrospirota bacterium]
MRKTPFIVIAVITTVFAVGLPLFPAGLAPAEVQAGLSPVRTYDAPALPEPHLHGDALPAKGKFLVASRTVADPRFQETVVLLIDYGDTGASGLIINRPTKVPLAELLPSVQGLKKRHDVLYYGGPVENERMLMLIRSNEKLEDADKVFVNVYVSMSGKTLERMIGAHKTQKQLRVYSGYAGWSPGQIDREVSRGDWYIVNADAGSIFEKKSSEIWRELIRRASILEVRRHGKVERSSS